MNKNTYTVVSSPATKVSVTISRRQLWNNFIDWWRDISWDDYRGVSTLKEVADVLLSKNSFRSNSFNLRKLFLDGKTVFLMGDAMKELDVPINPNILREIIVIDDSKSAEAVEMIMIPHEDINF